MLFDPHIYITRVSYALIFTGSPSLSFLSFNQQVHNHSFVPSVSIFTPFTFTLSSWVFVPLNSIMRHLTSRGVLLPLSVGEGRDGEVRFERRPFTRISQPYQIQSPIRVT